MLRLADWPIRRKLGLLTASGVLIALLLACLAFAVHNVHRIRAAKVEQIAALADILGLNATPALEFSDANTAAEVLSSLRLQPSIELAVLYDAGGQPFATYPAEPPFDHPVPPVLDPGEAAFTDSGHLVIAQPIRRGGDRIGTIYLLSSLKEIEQQLAQTLWILLGVMAAALGISTLITARLQRLFTAPIQELARATRQITAEGDYSIHVQRQGRDELGVLCDGFNTMLDRISTARNELQRAHDEMEERVIERTAELRIALEAAEAASRAKSDFLANMSHEIRTPMTAILGFADVLAEEGHLSERGREHVDTICRNANHLLKIINDILDLSKIEARRMTVERIEYSPQQIIGDVVSLMRPRAAGKGLLLELGYRGPIPETIRTDPTRLHQVLANLVDNAVKFTERGSVRLTVFMAEPATCGAPALCFEVRDTGVGMNPEQQRNVFRAFTQGDESMTRRFGGTGLGLTICKKLIELLGGALSVESEPGRGSTFRFSVDTGPLDDVCMLENCQEALPPPAAEQTHNVPPAVARLSARVLLCEDGPDNQRLISFLLDKAGAEVTVAENGQIGLDKVREAHTAERPFDVILMDMAMPVLDGYRAARQLRREGYEGPIIALTAHAMAHDRQKCLDAGCDDYVSKPIDRATLLDSVANHLPAARQYADVS